TGGGARRLTHEHEDERGAEREREADRGPAARGLVHDFLLIGQPTTLARMRAVYSTRTGSVSRSLSRRSSSACIDVAAPIADGT
ncbi:MAG: hypothetical protein JWM82_953, partial [Myxococcales bacterium]|nr:hypothetical protein [Myxococcales bacterium]